MDNVQQVVTVLSFAAFAAFVGRLIKKTLIILASFVVHISVTLYSDLLFLENGCCCRADRLLQTSLPTWLLV